MSMERHFLNIPIDIALFLALHELVTYSCNLKAKHNEDRGNKLNSELKCLKS